MFVNGNPLVREGNYSGELQTERLIKKVAVLKAMGIDNKLDGLGISFEVEPNGKIRAAGGECESDMVVSAS